MLSTLEKALALKAVSWFEKVPADELAHLARAAREVAFEPGEALMREGELGECLYVLVRGTVTVQKGPKGRTVAKLSPPAVVGDMAVLDAEPRSASVVAENDVRALRLSREDFYDILDERPEISRAIIRLLSRRLRNALEGMTSTPALPSAPPPSAS